MVGVIVVFIIIATIKNNEVVHTVNIMVIIHTIIFQIESLSYMPVLRTRLAVFVFSL